MTTKRNEIKATDVTFRFKGEKAAEIANALFVQWLDGGLADQFEDYIHEMHDVDLIHDWDSETLNLEIEVIPSGQGN